MATIPESGIRAAFHGQSALHDYQTHIMRSLRNENRRLNGDVLSFRDGIPGGDSPHFDMNCFQNCSHSLAISATVLNLIHSLM